MIKRTIAFLLLIIFLIFFWFPIVNWIYKGTKNKLSKYYKLYFHYLKIYAGCFFTGKSYNKYKDKFV